MQLIIEKATLNEVTECCNLLNQLFSQDLEFVPDNEKQTAGLTQIINNPNIGEILVLKKDNTVIGMVSLLYSISTALGNKVAILEDMIIDKNHRTSGYGSMLLEKAIAFAKERGCLRITLLTDYNNDVAIHFYKKIGFEKSQMIVMRQLL
jgi:ribosomal protein S18 acetylase RimI-like enzyme